MRKALCVGIDSYQNINDLHGCVNDANSVKSALADILQQWKMSIS